MSRFCKSFMTAFGNGVILCAARQRSLSFCQIRKINQQFVDILNLHSINNLDLFVKLSIADKFNKANVFSRSQNKQKRSFSGTPPAKKWT